MGEQRLEHVERQWYVLLLLHLGIDIHRCTIAISATGSPSLRYWVHWSSCLNSTSGSETASRHQNQPVQRGTRSETEIRGAYRFHLLVCCCLLLLLCCSSSLLLLFFIVLLTFLPLTPHPRLQVVLERKTRRATQGRVCTRGHSMRMDELSR